MRLNSSKAGNSTNASETKPSILGKISNAEIAPKGSAIKIPDTAALISLEGLSSVAERLQPIAANCAATPPSGQESWIQSAQARRQAPAAAHAESRASPRSQ